MKKLKNPEVIGELKRLSETRKGILMPEDVVAAAKTESSPLHKYFDWDDDSAAELWRLHQARKLISVVVEYIGTEDNGRECRVFVSLKNDRAAHGGYRAIVDVLKSPRLRDALLLDAVEEMSFFKEKYKSLKELAMVFKVMTKAEQKLLK